MRMVLIAGNWKMNNVSSQAKELVLELKELAGKEFSNGCVVVCPPFTVLRDVYEVIKDSAIKLGGQNMYWEEKGAFTGEISPEMLKDAGCNFVIIGHSERRKYFSETNETVNKRVKSALKHSLIPIICVGETLEEREADKTLDVIKSHVTGALEGLSKEDVQKIVIAYEPVWAIGTGRTASPEQAEEIHKYIRDLVSSLYSESEAENLLILYGGSVKPSNVEELIKQEDIDGALVGGAALKADSFSEIVKKSIR